jgi:hypothetical protein
MSHTTDQTEEEILNYEISDDALEAAGGALSGLIEQSYASFAARIDIMLFLSLSRDGQSPLCP